jgi:hypothetical protein
MNGHGAMVAYQDDSVGISLLADLPDLSVWIYGLQDLLC